MNDIEQDFLVTRFEDLDTSKLIHLSSIEEGHKLLLMKGLKNEYYSEDYHYFVISQDAYLKAMKEYLHLKGDYVSRYDGFQEVGVGYVGFSPSNTFIKVKINDDVIELNLASFDYVQMERG